MSRNALQVEKAPVYYPEHIAKVGERAFMKSVREYKDKTEGLFRELRAIRMPRPSMEVPIRRYLSEIKDYST